MKSSWWVALAAVLPVSAFGQDITQRPVTTERIAGVAMGVGLYEIAPDGTVVIDWRAVEAAAEGTADRTTTPIAETMLAISDGTWKPMTR